MGMDLGEGFPRRALLIGAALIIRMPRTLTLLFGLPNQRTLLIYFSIPLIVIWFGLQPSTKVRRGGAA